MKPRLWAGLMPSALFCLGACGGGDVGHPVTLFGRIEAIDESKLSWENLRLSLACNATLTEGGQVAYRAGDEYRSQPIGAARTFSFHLSAPIESGFVGRLVSQQSCVLWAIAYVDANGNGKLDYEGASQDPHELLRDANGTIFQLLYVRDTGIVNQFAKQPAVVGWNYNVEPLRFASDFSRECVLRTLR